MLDLDSLELSGHSFGRLHLDKRFDCYFCDMEVDGHDVSWIEPVENVLHLGFGTEQFENYMKAQALGAPRVTNG